MKSQQSVRWKRSAIGAMAGLALAASGVANGVGALSVDARMASGLARFYPTPLSTSPAGSVDDQAVWTAKVSGLLNGAPTLLQQSLLMSRSAEEFTSNLILLEQLQEGRQKRNASAMSTTAPAAGVSAQKALGDSSNLVYKPLGPCRIMDTRSAAGGSGVQGPLIGNTLYSIPGFITDGQNWSLYGQPAPLSDCGLDSTLGSDIYAVALVVTILNPSHSAFLGISDSNVLGTVLSRVALNFTGGQGLSTMYNVPQVTANTIRFALPAGVSAHLIFDVVGVFVLSDATALECTNEEQAATQIAVNPDTQFRVQAPACAAGFTSTSIACSVSGSPLPSVVLKEVEKSAPFFEGCTWGNGSAGIINPQAAGYTAVNRCCRVPGK